MTMKGKSKVKYDINVTLFYLFMAKKFGIIIPKQQMIGVLI